MEIHASITLALMFRPGRQPGKPDDPPQSWAILEKVRGPAQTRKGRKARPAIHPT